MLHACAFASGWRLCVATVALWGLLTAPAQAAAIWRICDQAAYKAATQTNVPYNVLRAISRTETGRTLGNSLKPWPWTVNMEGDGHWFDTLDEARSYVFKHFKQGARSFDVGCFQINYKWHQDGFQSIDDMFDPDSNALYAAEFLQSLYGEFGNWTDAVGAYHSRTERHATRYTERYAEILAALGPGAPTPTSPRQDDRPGRVAATWADLFGTARQVDGLVAETDREGVQTSPGSLVPLARSAPAFISLQQRGN